MLGIDIVSIFIGASAVLWVLDGITHHDPFGSLAGLCALVAFALELTL